MKGKISDIKNIIQNPDKFCGALLYGPNEYKVNENYQDLFNLLNKENNNTFELQEFDTEIILNQPEIFFNEINTILLGGGRKVIKIDMMNSDKAGCLVDYLEKPTKNTFIIVKSGKIGPSSKLRKTFENTKRFLAVPFYEDSIKDADAFIMAFLSSKKCTISSDAKLRLLSISGNDHKIIESNLELLYLYIISETDKEINIDIIDKILLSGKPAEIQNLCNCVAFGKVSEAFSCLNELKLNGHQPIQFINSLSRFFQRIHQVLISENSGKNISEAMSDLSPPVFFKEKDSFIKQTKLWNMEKTERALRIINEAENEIKESPDLGKLIINNIVLRLSAAANR